MTAPIRMNGNTILSTNLDKVTPPAELAAVLHPDYTARYSQWTLVRDCVEGEEAVKARKTIYLPKREKQTDTSYCADVARAVFFNATGRTLASLLSSIFRRPGVVHLPKGIQTESVTKDGLSLRKVERWAAEEVIKVSRAGGYVELPEVEHDTPDPYLCLYPAEHILSWQVQDGVPTMVLLAEQVADTDSTMNMFNTKKKWQCRLLALDEAGEYFQFVGTPEIFSSMTSLPPVAGRVYPLVYGKRLRSVPFRFFGLLKNTAEVEKPLLLDIANVNLHHYRASSNLERSRAFVGSPIYAVFSGAGGGSNGSEDEDELTVSPETIWEFDKDDKAEILEFAGSGMSSLENGMEEKEEQMRVLGARLVGQRKNAAARSAGAETAAEASDDATLLDVVESVSDGLTALFRIIAEWKREDPEKVSIRLNRHFSAPNLGARELRAIDACLNRSMRPADIFRLLQESGLIREDQDEEEYVTWIEELRAEQQAATRGDLDQPVVPKDSKPVASAGPTNS